MAKLTREQRKRQELRAALNVYHLRLFEAKGAVTGAMKHAERNDLDVAGLPDMLKALEALSARMLQKRDGLKGKA